MRWLFCETPPASGAYNMSLDEALMYRASQTSAAVFRVYSWSTPTLSLGRHQRARGFYYEDAARRLGVAFVRRPTGGRALLHHREVTYSATLPVSSAAEARSAYDFINDVLLAGLARLGVNAGHATNTIAVQPGPRPCFDVPAEHEIAVGARKLVGSAQWRRGGALLQHGSILVHDDQGMIADLSREHVKGLPPAATLAESLGFEPAIGQVAECIRSALRNATSRPVDTLVMERDVEDNAARLRSTYEDDSWTWRR
jgi:lipoate-protein ligase A